MQAIKLRILTCRHLSLRVRVCSGFILKKNCIVFCIHNVLCTIREIYSTFWIAHNRCTAKLCKCETNYALCLSYKPGFIVLLRL